MKRNRQPRLNPFAFPVETNVRFALLIVAAVMLAGVTSIGLQAVYLNRILMIGELEVPPVTASNDVWFAEAEIALFQQAGRSLSVLAVPVAVAAAVILLAALIYRRHPHQIRRRHRLQPIPPGIDTLLDREVESLARRAGLLPPRVEVPAGLSTGQGAQVFGLARHYAVRFDGARLQLRKQPAVFRAIFLHELAHIANGDVGRTYFAMALWKAVLVLVIASLLLGVTVLFFGTILLELTRGGVAAVNWNRLLLRRLPTFLFLLAQVGILLSLVHAIRASILRVREVYADWRAGQWGAESTLLAMLQRQPNTDKKGFGIRRRWQLHPTAQQRFAVLQDPTTLFQLTLDLPFYVGVLLAVATAGWLLTLVLPFVVSMGTLLLGVASSLTRQAWESGGGIELIAAFLILLVAPLLLALLLIAAVLPLGYLVTGTVGVQVQRQAVADLLFQRKSPSLWLPAVMLAVGVEVGLLLTPLALLSPVGLILAGTATNLPLQLIILIPWLLMLVVANWLGLAYVRYFASRLLTAHVGDTPPTGKQRVISLASAALLWLMYVPLFLWRIAFLYEAEGISAGDWLLHLVVVLLILLILAGTAFSVTWLLLKLWKVVRPARCPSCQQPLNRPAALYEACATCKQEPATWLFVGDPPPTATGAKAIAG